LTVENLNNAGEGMTVAILRVPSCLEINYELLEALKRNRLIAEYEVRTGGSEIVFYKRDMAPRSIWNF